MNEWETVASGSPGEPNEVGHMGRQFKYRSNPLVYRTE